jgi:pimeloyl-ACP methyl ester carboxylesterase
VPALPQLREATVFAQKIRYYDIGRVRRFIARCGHLPPLEQPDEFVAAVTSFLRPA